MDNNQNKNPKQRDSFAKPGDESIVSGKSFFLSFGKQKKNNTNPLLESEKNKNAKDNKDNKDNGNNSVKKQNHDNKPTENKSSENGENRRDKNNFKNKNHHRRPDKNRNEAHTEKSADTETKPQKNAEEKHTPERDDRKNNHGEKNGGNRNANANHKPQNGAAPKDGTEQQANRDEHSRKDRRNDRNDRRNRNNAQQEKSAQSTPEADKNIKKTAENTQHEKNEKNDKNNTNSRQERIRPKHKKEKFVPTSPEQEIKSEELLQPIVDKTGIVSAPRGFGIRGGKSAFMSSQKDSVAYDKDEPRYIDRNRPLAEQILEQSKPKTYKNHLTENTETVEVIGVRFREAGKVYYFAPGGNTVEKGVPVIVETARGVEYGFCAIPNRRVSTDNIVPPLKPILRVATKDDTERYESNKQLEAGAAKVFREKVRALGLEMSLVYVEYTFDNGKLLFYFTADGRVDFRELIKELAAAFRTRIELRQIGVRDEAKIVGGLGICGRPVCCKSFLGEFSQVSIKMAKDQNLFINSSKISGTCGRFMCCIRYEDEVYQKEYERTPKVDAIVETPEGKGVVVESNALKGVVKVLLDDKPEEIAKPFKCTEIKLLGYVKRENENEIPADMEIPEEGSGS